MCFKIKSGLYERGKMNIIVKKFNELSTEELYEILKARAEIFVVEQKCIYQDLDDIDYKSVHFFYKEGKRITAYLRAFPVDEDFNTIQMGRVLSIRHGKGMGRRLLEDSINIIKKELNPKQIVADVQKYAIGFYEKFGFVTTSDEFLEDGIPHVKMTCELQYNMI